MGIEAPLDPPDDGTPNETKWDCPSCETFADCTEWVEVHGRYEATITTICNACEYSESNYDYTYGYDG